MPARVHFYVRFVVLLLLACGDASSETTEAHTMAVLGGGLAPDTSFPISPQEQNAVVAQITISGGDRFQGCTGTLVGDRVVAIAAHCVIYNQREWLEKGEAPISVPPGVLRYVVGADIDQALCELKAQSVTLHPQLRIVMPYPLKVFARVTTHDLALVILKESVLEHCTKVRPLHIPRAALRDDLVGQEALQGGYGALTESYDFSPIRYWSLLKIGALDDFLLVTEDNAKGNVSMGDSGSGLFVRYANGALHSLGVLTVMSGFNAYAGFARLDKELSFIDSVITPALRCGILEDSGKCDRDVAMNCEPSGITYQDCKEKGLACDLSNDLRARCVSTTAPQADAGLSLGAEAGLADGGHPRGDGEDGGGCTVGSASFAGRAPLMLLVLVFFWRRNGS